MVSEEVELNHAMDAAGIDALESDMGEYIVQLAGETLAHHHAGDPQDQAGHRQAVR